jgi:lycopene cyclase domain-containing protein
MSRFQCLLLVAACLPVTFCLWPTVVVFLVWDAVAVARDHWRYDPRYVTGWNLPFSVPIEELVFFIVIPVCGRLTFETVRNTPGRGSKRG